MNKKHIVIQSDKMSMPRLLASVSSLNDYKILKLAEANGIRLEANEVKACKVDLIEFVCSHRYSIYSSYHELVAHYFNKVRGLSTAIPKH